MEWVLAYIAIALITTWVTYFFDKKRGKADKRMEYVVAGILFPVLYIAIIITIIYAAVFGTAEYMAKKERKKRR